MDLGRQRLECVPGFAPHLRPVEDRAAVHLQGHAVHGAAGHRHAAAPGLADAIEPGKGGQQTRMEVDDPAGEGLQKRGLDDPHEAGQDDQIGLLRPDRRDEAGLALPFQLGLERGRIDVPRRHAEAGAQRENAGVGPIRKQRGHASLPEAAVGLSLQQRLGIGAAARAENHDTHQQSAFIWAISLVVLWPGRKGTNSMRAPTLSSAANSVRSSVSRV